MPNKLKVPVATAQEMIQDIKLLALSGKTTFKEYLYNPLHNSGWHSIQTGINRRKIMEMLKRDSRDPAYLHTIAPRCKKLILQSMDESLAALGECSIFFLERMQIHTAISSGIESIEFSEILNPPLKDFRKTNSEKSENLFSEAVNDAETEEIKAALNPVKTGYDSEKVKLDSEIRRLYENIRIASQYQNIPKCRKLLSSYIIQYTDDDDYARNDVEKLVNALNNREPGFEEDLKNTIAIDLYYRITQGIMKGNIQSTITAIRKYGYIFEGDTSSKYFYDIDRLERILYKMISDKDLWNELKTRRR